MQLGGRAGRACLMKISRRRDWPKGLYLRLKRSKRWNVFLSACMSSVSTFRSCLLAEGFQSLGLQGYADMFKQ